MALKTLNKEAYIACARQMVAEGCVLLKNDNQALPVRKNEKVAVFGRCAFNYYKSGLGSGGMVNTSYEVSILDALKACEDIEVNEELLGIYEEWIKEHPYDKGQGWGKTPWSQEEMPVTDRMLEIAKEAEVALVIIGRTAGEDQDNRNEEGSYLLTSVELDLLEKVSKANTRTIVLFNVGNVLDMKWAKTISPAAILYAWQGGQEGGNGVLDVLMGRVTPSGKLATTIASSIEDYPSTKNFGSLEKNYYAEDIYVGYRYFETFEEGRDCVMYPFGFGMSYTTFEMDAALTQTSKEEIIVEVKVKNTGAYAGKEVALVYIDLPQKELAKPKRVLAGFAKTHCLAPNEEETLTITCKKSYFASYDETGITGHASSWVLEEGTYEVLVGGDIRAAKACGTWTQELQVLETLEQTCAPVEAFERMTRKQDANGSFILAWEKVPVKEIPLEKQLKDNAPVEIPYTGDKGYKLSDVYHKKITLDEFIAQLSDEDLIGIFHGEGMCSNRVTPGVAAAFGGVTDSLAEFGIPAAACADGPSGIRMDCGTKAFSMPNGAAIASSYNQELTEELFEYVGLELRKNKIDSLLGPGINILRNPLNGRNFEYFSEDPLLTGKLCVAQLKGFEKVGVTGTIKHFCANNQEQNRYNVESVVSEKALREIYLKGFEIAVKEGGAKSIMTTYNPVNGLWTAGYFELCTMVLRKQWGYQGMVMSDWWAVANWPNGESAKEIHAPMVQAQNDVFMVCTNSQGDLHMDDVVECLEKGVITRAELQRNAKNVMNFLLGSLAMQRLLGIEEELVIEGFSSEEEEGEKLFEMESYKADEETGIIVVDREPFVGEAGKHVVFELEYTRPGLYELEIEYSSENGELAQLPVSVYYNNMYQTTISVNGTNGQAKTITYPYGPMSGRMFYWKFVFGSDGLTIRRVRMIPKEH